MYKTKKNFTGSYTGGKPETLTIYQVAVIGYNECPFAVNVGELFVAQKKKADCRNALKVIDMIRDPGLNRVTSKEISTALAFKTQNFILLYHFPSPS